MRRIQGQFRKQFSQGVTLLELMVVIAILAILATIATPSYKNLIESQKLRSVVNEWQSSFYFAQREAIRLKQPVIFCGSADGLECTSNAAHEFSNGWIVYAGAGSNKRILQDVAFNDRIVNITMNNDAVFKKEGLRFMPNGRMKSAAGTLTVKIVDNGVERRKRELSINTSGRLVAK